MLQTLSIRNIAVIDSAVIPFKPGLNILSGETGAGKSIVIEAISLLLGSRASADLVRAGCDEAMVEGLFDLAALPWMAERLERHGFPIEERELLIKRTVSRTGRNRVWINGQMATLSTLQEVCEDLVDLCGQHEHQSLLKSFTQLDLVDRYGGLTDQTRGFGARHTTWRALSTERAALLNDEAERTRKADFLKFQIAELQGAELQLGEDETLQQEKQLLMSAQARIQTAEAVREALEAEETGALNSLRAALSKIRPLQQLDPRVALIRDCLDRALAEGEDANLQLDRYLGTVELDPERLSAVQERLSLIADLRRKYGTSVERMLETLAQLELAFAKCEGSADRLQRVMTELDHSRAILTELGNKLSAVRRKVAAKLASAVTEELKDLKMGEARFQIELEYRDSLEQWSAQGADAVQFVVQTNRGEEARPLGKIASGGELSRLMLAIRRVIADRGGIGVYLFDEIDAGIGGQTAFQVGKKLRSVAEHNQVICITHLPQVASFAHHHLSVRKVSEAKRTVTTVVELNALERKQELARMLGGPELTKKSLDNAAELLELARGSHKSKGKPPRDFEASLH